MKIKIFTDTSRSRLEDKVNNFLEHVSSVNDIKFSTAAVDDNTKTGRLYHSVIVQYCGLLENSVETMAGTNKYFKDVEY